MQSNTKAFTSRAASALRNPHALTPLILFMGCIGAAMRYALEAALPANGVFPFATLIINIFGCFVLELVNSYIGRRMHLPGPLVKSLGVGLVGAFTTISAFSTECLTFLQTGEYALWAAYVAATVASTFLAALAGHGVCLLLAARRMKRMQARREAIHKRHAAAREHAKQMRATAAKANTADRQTSQARTSQTNQRRCSPNADGSGHANKGGDGR
jgi:fluoride exporter